MDADHEGDDGQHARQNEKEAGPDNAARIGQQREQECQDERPLRDQLADGGQDGNQRREPENARTLRNRAAQTGSGPRRAELALSASVLIERWAPGTQSGTLLVCVLTPSGTVSLSLCALNLSPCALSLSKGAFPRAPCLLPARHPGPGVTS